MGTEKGVETSASTIELMPIKAFNVTPHARIRLSKKFVENFIKEPDMGSSMLPDYLVNPSAGYQVLDREKDEADTMYTLAQTWTPAVKRQKKHILQTFPESGMQKLTTNGRHRDEI